MPVDLEDVFRYLKCFRQSYARLESSEPCETGDRVGKVRGNHVAATTRVVGVELPSHVALRRLRIERGNSFEFELHGWRYVNKYLRRKLSHRCGGLVEQDLPCAPSSRQ